MSFGPFPNDPGLAVGLFGLDASKPLISNVGNGQMYVATDTGHIYQAQGGAWVQIVTSGAAAVTSVFGRAGVVVAAANDYTPAQVGSLAAPAAAAYTQWGAAAFATVRQPNVNRPTLVIAGIRITVNKGDNGSVQVLCDTGIPPTTVIAAMRAILTDADAVNARSIAEQWPVTFIVAAGDRYEFTTTISAGAPTFTLAQVFELTL